MIRQYELDHSVVRKPRISILKDPQNMLNRTCCTDRKDVLEGVTTCLMKF